MRCKILLPLAFAGSLGACVSPTVQVSNDVAAAEVTLTGLENAATIYTALPRCAAGGPAICSDPTTVQKIKDLDNKAYQAVTAARQNAALLSTALIAIGSLKDAIPAISAANAPAK